MACLNDDFEKAVDIVAQCRGRVVMTGIGKSGLICKKIASTLSSIGVSAIFPPSGPIRYMETLEFSKTVMWLSLLVTVGKQKSSSRYYHGYAEWILPW